MIYLNYALGFLVLLVLLGFLQWTFKDLKQLVYGQKKRKVKKR